MTGTGGLSFRRVYYWPAASSVLKVRKMFFSFLFQQDEFCLQFCVTPPMTLYYCGWNGCGQVNDLPSIISRPTDLSVDGSIVSVSCSWSVLSVATGELSQTIILKSLFDSLILPIVFIFNSFSNSDKSVTITGFVGNEPKVSKKIALGTGSKAVNVSARPVGVILFIKIIWSIFYLRLLFNNLRFLVVLVVHWLYVIKANAMTTTWKRTLYDNSSTFLLLNLIVRWGY